MITRRTALRMASVSLAAAGIALAGGTWALTERALTVPPSPVRPEGAPSGPGGAEGASPEPWGFEEVDWEGWSKEAPALIAWVQLPEAGLSMPVMAPPADDGDYYLDHDAWGAWNPIGTPFLDADCQGDFDIGCAPILGHHLSDGRGFSVVAELSDPARARELSPVLLQTRAWRRVYDVLFVSVVDAGRHLKRTAFANAADFAIWWGSEIEQAAAVLDSRTVPRRVIQLVTCSYSTYANERTVATCAQRLELPPSSR
ncbi:class B sortase [Adlercreutzia caecimuris]|uniref:class B sortase n=1 Tax=Adlercreutzia caecimuris TaxID=671266 RepID=UPI001C3D4BE7|nr:class B sortase [Adlercreutzia caecimuris]